MELKKDSKELIKKVLPVNYPMITSYTQHAHLLSILSNYECTYPWIYSNYIQLYINEDYKNNWGDFYFPFPYELRPSDTCKWIFTQKIHRDVVNCKWESIINFIIECINSNNYVHTMINFFYVALSSRYNKVHLNHDILIFGFDLNEEVLYVSDFFGVGKYSYEKISFLDFSRAYSSYSLSKNQDYLNGMVYLYKFNAKSDYQFSIKNISNSIKSYLYSSIPEYWDCYNRDNREDIVFGMEIYTTLKNYIAKKRSSRESDIDIRPFYMLYDHKKIMLLRLKYLYGHNYYKNYNSENIIGITEIETQASDVVNLLIKYNVSKNNIILDKVVNILNNIEKNEKNILEQYI
jgi:hypothetical protein